MTFLFWLACGTAFRIVSSVFGIPPSTVHEMTNRILSKIVASADHFIKIPPEAELGVIGAAFARAAQSAVFSVCVGAIGGVHIKTLCPGQLHDQHIDRKLKYSISMQAIVDHQGQFINIMAGFPGSYQDSRILRYSSVYRRSLYPPRGYFLVGDSGYPCMREPITIITPYKEPGLIPQKREFNTALSKARICVEQSFGMMKTRWSSIFIKDVEVRLRKGVQVLAACAIMHNICVLNNDLFAPELQQPVLPRQQPRDEADGIRHRDIMLALFRAERNV
ncbi:hypothetical protein PR048_005957 [Dryococelus australis]|uniref:DDE Tnp4 domain-containing protein n=1 Tax=Dryococelus australis TaxID=614101 RepID=A0ABQ9I9P2_9NEOP|nr:hypothetical protein PR048_005957 [Dryococelus australis]